MLKDKYMNHKNNRPPYDPVRAMAVHLTAAQFNCGADWVRKVIKGSKHNEELLRFYRSSYAEIAATRKVVHDKA